MHKPSDRIKEYYESDRLSNSKLSRILTPWKFNAPQEDRKNSKALRIGSAIDCLLTDPGRWHEEFVVKDFDKPYGKIAVFIENLPEGLTRDSPQEEYMIAYEVAEYSYSLKVIINKLWNSPDLVSYYHSLTEDAGKVVLGVTEYNLIKNCVRVIQNSPYCTKYFQRTSSWIDLDHQVAIYFDYLGEKCKGLLDGVLIDHESKTIQPFDLKTSSLGIFDFTKSMLTFGYYRQAAFYDVAIHSDASPYKDLIKDGYEVLPFRFIVVDTTNVCPFPLIYQMSQKDLKAGLIGGMVGTQYYPGINDLIDLIKFHTREGYEYPKEIIDSNGVINTKVF